MERITATQALSAGFSVLKRRAGLLAGIGLCIGAVSYFGIYIESLWGVAARVIISLAVIYPLQAGLELISLGVARRTQTGLGAFSDVGRRWGSLVAAAGIRFAPLAFGSSLVGTAGGEALSHASLGFALSLVGLVVSLIFAFAPILLLDRENPIASSEHIGLRASLRHSARLTRGRKRTLFAISLLAFIPIVIIVTVAMTATGVRAAEISDHFALSLIFSLISGAILLPWISASTMAVFDQAASDHPDVAEPIEYEVLGSEDAD